MVEPLSNNDISKKLNKYGLNVDFVPYKQLKHLDSLDDIIPCFLLYQQHYPIGHWVALFRNEEGVNYFDPTGRVPDKLIETNFDNPAGRVEMNADYTYLNQLLLQASENGEQIIYNDQPLQIDDSNTCGFWTGIRLMTTDILNDEFNELFMDYDGDERQKKIVKIWKKL